MKKRYSLPIETPQFVCCPHLTFANAIVRANVKEDLQVLFCSKHINCFYYEPSVKRKFVISAFDHWCMQQKIMQCQHINILKEIYITEKTDLIAMIKKCLYSGSYVLGQCNCQYIENINNDEDSIFYFAMTGFDDIAQEFTVYGINQSNDFACFKIHYVTFIKSLFDIPNPIISLILWRFNPDATIALDIPNIIFDLDDYMHSTNNRKEYTADKTYGLAAIERLSQHFWDIAVNGEDLSEAYLNKFLLHKIYMRERIEYLASQGIIDKCSKADATLVNHIGEEVYQLGVIFNNTRDIKIIKTIIDYISQTVEKEEDYLSKVLEKLKEY